MISYDLTWPCGRRRKAGAFVFLVVLILALAEPVISSAASAVAQSSSGANRLPSEAEIRKILADRVGALAGPEDGIGIVVGLVGPQGRRVFSLGHFDQADARSLGRDTVFEIASITKGFTGLLLAEMVQKGEVALSDPVTKYLPAEVKIPERNGKVITLLDLATHTSGLPFMPDGTPTKNAAALYDFLGRYKLTRDVGSEWDYSNIGYWLLSQALASRAGEDFDSLLQKRVLAPLKLTNTAFKTSATMKAKLAPGHNASLQPAPLFPSLPGYSIMPAAGGLYSTVDDLLTVASAAMGCEPSPLALAFATSLKTRRPMSKPGMAQALGWIVIGEGNDELIFHDGGSFGYASAMVWSPANRMGVVVLSNHVQSVSDIARHLLQPAVSLEHPIVTRHTEITLSVDSLKLYAGRYDATGEGIFAVDLEENFLTIEAPSEWGLPKLRLHPESAQDFFATELPLRATFQTDGAGRVTHLLVYPPRGQRAVPAKRIGAP